MIRKEANLGEVKRGHVDNWDGKMKGKEACLDEGKEGTCLFNRDEGIFSGGEEGTFR